MSCDPEASSIWEHLEELRRVLIHCIMIIGIGVVLCMFFYEHLFEWILLPLKMKSPFVFDPVKQPATLILLSPVEGFSTMLRISFWAGLILTAPAWLYTVMKFISPALRRDEKRMIIPFFLISFLFAFLGFAFAYWLTIPAANQFLMSFNESMGTNLWSLQYYLDFTLTLLLAHIVAFESAVVLLFLVHLGIISAETLEAKRSHAIVAILIIAALLTPPDVLTQILLAIPMMLLYEALIIYGKVRAKMLALQRRII